MNDSGLVRARAGDHQAFAALTDPYRRELQLHCYRILGQVQDAEDAVQETLLSAWRALESFEERSTLRPWLYRIATNRCLNMLRDSGRRPAAAALPASTAPEPTRYGEVLWLEHSGVTFHRNETGHLDLRAFGGASMKRTAYVADITGQAILHVLYEQLVKSGVTVYEEWFALDLVTDGERCVGVTAWDLVRGGVQGVEASAVIMATGVSGCSRAISSISSWPVPSGRRMSVKQRS